MFDLITCGVKKEIAFLQSPFFIVVKIFEDESSFCLGIGDLRC